MDKKREDLAKAAQRVTTLEKFIADAQVELHDQEHKADATQAIVDQVHAEVEVELEAARKRYADAIAEVGGLSEQDLAEIRSYNEPHVLVRLVVMSLCVLFDSPTDWRNAQRLLGEQNPKLIDRCREFNVSGLSAVQAAKLARLVQEPEFNIVSVEQVSVAAKSLCWWVLSVNQLLRTQKECDLKLGRIKEGEERLANTYKYIRKLRGELSAGQTELARQQHDHHDLQQQLGEAGAQLRDNDLQKANILKLTGLVQSLLDTWRERLAAVEARIPSLVGDAALCVACATYLGPLTGAGRAAVLSTWREVLRERGVPVSASFSLSAFMTDRFAQMAQLLPADFLANVEPLWRDNWALMFMSQRPPLLLDPGREGANLVKTAFGKNNRLFFVLTEDGLQDKVLNAIRNGKVVIVDIYGHPREAPLLARLHKVYEQAMARTYANLATEPHHLYLRLRAHAPQLHPALLQYFMPVSFALRCAELRSRLVRTLLSSLAHEREMAARQMATKLWQHKARMTALADSITFTIAATKGLIWTHPGLVDSTVTKANQAKAAAAELPLLEAELAEEQSVVDKWTPLIDGAMRCHAALQDLSALRQPPRDATAAAMRLPATQLVNFFRAALQKAVAEVHGAAGLVRELQGSTAPPLMSEDEVKQRGAKAAVAQLLSRAPSRAMSRAMSMAHSRMDSDSAPATPPSPALRLHGGGGGGTRGGDLHRQLLARQDSCTSTTTVPHGAAGQPPGSAGTEPGGGRHDSFASSIWPAAGGFSVTTSHHHAAALLAAQQLLEPPAPPPTCAIEELLPAVLQGLTRLVCCTLGQTDSTIFRLLVALHEQQAAGKVTADELQLACYVLCCGSPSAQDGMGPHGDHVALRPAAWQQHDHLESSRLPSMVVGPSSARAQLAPLAGDGNGGSTSLTPRRDSTAQQDAQPDQQQAHEACQQAATGAAGQAEEGQSGVAAPVARSQQGAAAPELPEPSAAAAAAHRALPDTAAAGGNTGQHVAGLVRGSSFFDAAAQRALQLELPHAGSTHDEAGAAAGAPEHGHGATPAAEPWPGHAALADLAWLEGCSAVAAQLAGVTGAVREDPEAWRAALTVAATGAAKPGSASAPCCQPLPDKWRALLEEKPAMRVLLTSILVPVALVAAAEALAGPTVGPALDAAPPGERLLSTLMAAGAGAPVLLETLPGEDPMVAVQQAQSLCIHGLLPLEPSREAQSQWRGVEVVVRHVQPDQVNVRDLRATLGRAARSGAWMVLLNAHAGPQAVVALLEQLNAKEYTLRGPDVTFRLILAMPAGAVAALHPNVHNQCIHFSLAPPASLRAYVSGAMLLLGLPQARRFVSLFGPKGSSLELTTQVLAVAVLIGGLGRALAASFPVALAPPLTWWDLLAATRLIRQAIASARAADDQSSLDYAKLHQVLLHEVLLPALPSAERPLRPFVQWALGRLLQSSSTSLQYVSGGGGCGLFALLQGCREDEAGQEAQPSLPLNATLPAMLDYLRALGGMETVLQPHDAWARAQRATGSSLAFQLALHRLALAAPRPVRRWLLPAEDPASEATDVLVSRGADKLRLHHHRRHQLDSWLGLEVTRPAPTNDHHGAGGVPPGAAAAALQPQRAAAASDGGTSPSSACSPVPILDPLRSSLSSIEALCRTLAAQLTARLADTTSRAAQQRAPLSSMLQALFGEVWLQEARQLHDTVAHALGEAEQLAAALSPTPHDHDLQPAAQLLEHLQASCVPPSWHLAPAVWHPCHATQLLSQLPGPGGYQSAASSGGASGGGGSSLVPYHAVHTVSLATWEEQVRSRARLLKEVVDGEVDGELVPVSLDLAQLAQPSAVLACMLRAAALEHNTSPAHLVCRVCLQPPLPEAALASHASAAGHGHSHGLGTALGSGLGPGPVALTRFSSAGGLTPAAAASGGGSVMPSATSTPLPTPSAAAGHGASSSGGGGGAKAHPSASGRTAVVAAPRYLAITGLASRDLETWSRDYLPDGCTARLSARAAAAGGVDDAAASHQQQLLCELRPCPVLYVVPGFADPAARKAMRANARGSGRQVAAATQRVGSRTGVGMLRELAGGSAAAPTIGIPLVPVPAVALLNDVPFTLAWECRPGSLAAEAPPERMPLLSIGGGNGEVLHGTGRGRTAVLLRRMGHGGGGW